MAGVIGYPSNVIPLDPAAGGAGLREAPMSILLRKLSAYYPAYTFVCNISGSTLYDVKVMCGQETLGQLTREFRGHDWHYGLRTKRIVEESRSGKKVKVTSSEETALKLFKKYFQPMNAQERLDKQLGKISSEMGKTSQVKRKLDEYFVALSEGLRQHLWDQFEVFAPIALQGGTSSAVLKEIPDLLEQVEITQAIRAHYNNGTGKSVVIMNDRYHFSNGDYSFAELTDEVKTQLGMLKLLDNATFLRDVGLRVDESTFFLVPYIDKTL